MVEPYEHTTPTRTLVTGATGTTGRLVRAALERLGAGEIVVASRRPDDPSGVRFDWNDPSTHSSALAGVDAAYLVPPTGSASPVEVMGPFLRRAVDVGLRRAVLLGALPVERGGPGVGEVYEVLAMTVPQWAVLRPSWFMQNVLGDHQQARSLRDAGVMRTATGDGRVAFIDAADVADVAATLLLAQSSGNTEIVLTGPQNLSYDDVARVLTEVTRRTVKHERLTVAQLRDEVFTELPRDFAQMLADMDGAIAAGVWSTVTDEVMRVTGRAPRSFLDFARAHRVDLGRP